MRLEGAPLKRKRSRQDMRRDWAARKLRLRAAYTELLRTLGGKCTACGTMEALSVEHVEGKTYESRSLSLSQRITRYWEEYRNGVKLTVLCVSCNSKARDWRRAGWKPQAGSPQFDAYMEAIQHAKWIEEYESGKAAVLSQTDGQHEPEREPGDDADDSDLRELASYVSGRREGGDAPSDERGVAAGAVDPDEEAPF